MYYHYTNLAAFLGIIESKQLWFSSMSYMNDESEGVDFINTLDKLLGCSNSDSKYRVLFNTVSQLTEAFLSDKYLFSATQLRDDISQWRAYTTLGHGVSFGFEDGLILEKEINKVSCIYDHDKKVSFLNKNTDFIKYVNDEFSLEKRKDGSVSRLVDSVLNGMECFKNASFSPENETRWVQDINSIGPREVLYRPHKMGLMPYRKINIDIREIKEVILGPTVPRQNIETMRRLLKNHGDTAVSLSKVTLR